MESGHAVAERVEPSALRGPARVAPTAMIFVPCKDGVSHNEIEDAKPADLEAGCNVLLDAMVARANPKQA